MRSARRFLRTALCLVLVLACGCVGSFWSVAETDGTLEDSMRTYTKLVRWGELERASLFVDESLRAEFLALAPGLEHLRFTDFDMGPVEFDETGARVTVVYGVYDVRTLVEHQIVETQRWSGSANQWLVEPDLTGFRKAVGAPGAVGASHREPAG